MSRRTFPLFIIDVSRAHGRAWETDYISCTSAELPFVAEVTFIKENQYLREYDKNNPLIIYDNGNNNRRIRIEVIHIRADYDVLKLRALLHRALKEYITRRNVTANNNVPFPVANKLNFINELIKQGNQQKRREPENEIVDLSLKILNDIKKDYEQSEN